MLSHSIHWVNPTAVRHWCTQHFESKNKSSTVAVETRTALSQQWKWQCWGNNVHISVTVIATNSFHSDVLFTVTIIWTSLSQSCQLSLLSQHCQCHRCHTTVISHWYHTSEHSNATSLSVSLPAYIADTLICCYHHYNCHNAILNYHWCHIIAGIIVTAVTLVWTAVWQ